MTENLTLDLNNFQIIQSIKENILLIEKKDAKMQYVAIIDKTKNDGLSKQNINNDLLQSYFDIKYPTILKFYGYSTVDFNSDPNPTYIIEYASNGSLQDISDKEKLSKIPNSLTSTKKYIITLGLALCINFLHSKSIFLGNFQPSNIFLDENCYPLVCFFDFIKDQTNKPYYRAPETFSKDPKFTNKSDVFSFASVVFDMIDLSKIDVSNKALFNKCMSETVVERPTFLDVIDHITTKSFIDIFGNVDIDEIFNFLKKFIDLNDSEAMFMIASVFSLDESRKKETLNYFKLSADAGNSYSMHRYGRMLYYGDGVEINFNEALHYFKMSADKGNHYGINAYGIMLLKGEGCDVNVPEAIRYFKMAIEKDDGLAMLNYAQMNLEGNGIPINTSEAAYYFKMAADHGNPSAAVNYGALAMKGDGVQLNVVEGLRYFKKAADLDYDEGIFRYAFVLETYFPAPNTLQEAFRCYKNLVDKGDSRGMLRYGRCLIEGLGTPVNIQEGIRYVKMAIDNGDASAMHEYALMLLKGGKIPKNVPESIRYLRMASDNGYSESMYTLGILNHTGECGVKINKAAAIHYYKLAISKENSKAMCKLGEMLWNGDGVQVNKAAAIHYINMAMERGNQDARRVLNSMEYKPCTIC